MGSLGCRLIDTKGARVEFDGLWKERKWCTREIKRAPRWCSVDLRDGNQALIDPMTLEKKLRFFGLLVNIGFKEIEVGFPSASEVEFEFCRVLIERNMIPADVWISVLVQARAHLIDRTMEAIHGCRRAIVHFYAATSTMHREIVFDRSMEQVKAMAVDATKRVKEKAEEMEEKDDTTIRLEFSPEAFTQTELPFALDVCHAVMSAWGGRATEENKIILNLPATVEVCSPNVHADMIEWMHVHFKDRNNIMLSLHPHNDRGTAVAAAELGLLAGADRVEGCLFGNGERTGNVCLVTLALNLLSDGVDPELDFSDLRKSVDIAEYCNGIKIPDRWPWAGSLVYTAFSGSHQDAIKKGMAKMMSATGGKDRKKWQVPYLAIDPGDVGCSYEALVRINSQSGKGGMAFVLEQEFGIALPKNMQVEFAREVQVVAEDTGKEVSANQIYATFHLLYLPSDCCSNVPLLKLRDYNVERWRSSIDEEAGPSDQDNNNSVTARLVVAMLNNPEETIVLHGKGNGPLSAALNAVEPFLEKGCFEILSYEQKALQRGETATSISFVELSHKESKLRRFGVGMSPNVTSASLHSLFSAINHIIRSINAGERTTVCDVEAVRRKTAQLDSDKAERPGGP